MNKTIWYSSIVYLLCALLPLTIGRSASFEEAKVDIDLETSGVQSRIGMVTQIRVTDGETHFYIDSCPVDRFVPSFFVISATNPDKLDITRLLVAAMSFKKEVKLYNTAFGADIDYCPSTGHSVGNVTVGTVRVQGSN